MEWPDGSSEAPPASEPPMMRQHSRFALESARLEARWTVQDGQNSKEPHPGIYRTYGKLKERETLIFLFWWTVSWNKQIENQMTPRNDKKTILSFWDGTFSGANLLLNCLVVEGDVFVFTDSIYRGRSSPFLFHHHLAPTIVINGVVNGPLKWVSGVITPIRLGEYLWNFFPSALTRVANLSP